MTDERVVIADIDQVVPYVDVDKGQGASVRVYGPESDHHAWAGQLADLLRAGLAAEEAPEGLWAGPVVDGQQTYYGRCDAVPDGWVCVGSDDGQWDTVRGWEPVDIVQCRTPAPRPVTVDVPLAHVIGRTLPGYELPIRRPQHNEADGWVWQKAGWPESPSHGYIPVNADGTVTVLVEVES